MSAPSSLLQGLSEEAVWRLEAACCRFEQAWRTGRRPDLWELLDGTSGPERSALLRELLRLDVHYRRLAGDAPSADDYRAGHPCDEPVLRAVLAAASSEAAIETTDGRINGHPIVCVGELSAHAAGEGAPAGADTRLAGRYRLLRFHARGGLGEVHVAEDTELDREVALKQMQAENAADPDSRFRFVLEGAVTGGLEHPGIVPVYGRGTQADGRPFYAMRLIRGETLAAHIARFHAQTPGRFDSMEFRQLLGRFVAVCQAVAYANSRGVLHRDLKPGNVMLGPFGETLLLDWGLAKVVGDVKGGAGVEATPRLAVLKGAETVGAVGTPAYMSPEQAAGRTEELGPTTDVYGLGATLYEMLTGAAPVQGNLFEVLSKVVAGSWKPPRQLSWAVPPALDAICCKAMALRPQDRYASAQELAKDVEAWLADEPVAAYGEPASARLRRWVRKRPRRVTAAVVLLVTAVVGLTLGTVLLQRSKRQAEDSYKIARQGVNHFLREVSEDVLLDEPGMQPLRQSLLNEALNYHEGFLKIRPDDPEGRQQFAEIFRLGGELDGEVSRPTEGKASLTRAVALYEGLLKTKPADRELRFGLARCWLSLAELQMKFGEMEAGRETICRALEVLSALREEEPGRVPVLCLLGRCLDLRATAEAHRGSVDMALRNNQEAHAILEQAVTGTLADRPPMGESMAYGEATGFSGVPKSRAREWRNRGVGMVPNGESKYYDPERWGHLRLIAGVLANKGTLLEATGRAAGSARAFQEAADLFGWLSEQRPRSGRARHALALALLGAGRAEVELGRPAAGERNLRKAVGLLEELGAQDAYVPEYKHSLLRARGFLGECLFARGRHQAAAALLRAVVEDADKLMEDTRKSRPLLADHPWFLTILGRLQAELGRHDEALSCCNRAAQLQKEVLALAPGNATLSNTLLRIRETLSELRHQKAEIGRDDQIADQRQILREREELARGDPQSPGLRSEVGASAAVLAGLLLQAGRPRQAIEVVEQALPPHEALVRADLQRSQEGRGSAQPLRPRWSTLQLDVTGIGPRRATPPSLSLRSQWAKLLAHKSAAHAATGQGAAGREAVAKAVALSEEIAQGRCCWFCPPWSWASVWSAIGTELYRQDPEPCHLYDLAGHLALASTLPGTGIADPATRAVQALRELIASGFDNPDKLRKDERLAFLRNRQDFQDLIRQLQAHAAGRPVLRHR
jgi:serine/threonine-protein kinase